MENPVPSTGNSKVNAAFAAVLMELVRYHLSALPAWELPLSLALLTIQFSSYCTLSSEPSDMLVA